MEAPKMLVKLLDFQKKYILDDSTLLVVEKGRQQGLTWVSPYKIIRRIFQTPVRQDHYWISRDEFTAKQFIMDCLDWIRVFNIVAEVDQVPIEKVLATRIKFPNGANIYVLSSSVNAVVGKRGHFYLDEFAVHEDQEALYDIALPCISWGFTMTIISTHRSKIKFFYKLIQKIRNGELKDAKVMTITLEDALKDGLNEQMNVRRILAGKKPLTRDEFRERCRLNASSEEIFMQEYMCIPADAESSEAIKEEELIICMKSKGEIFIHSGARNGQFYIGVDIGRHRDLTSIWVLEDCGTPKEARLITRYYETISQTEFTQQEDRIAKLLKEWKPRACYIDGTNTGAMIAENLSKKFYFCESVLLTAKTRPKFIGDGINLIKNKIVEIPDEKEVFSDFTSVERYINKYGQVDYFIPSRGRDGGHGDRFMSYNLAVQAFLSKKSLSKYVLKSDNVVKDDSNTTQKVNFSHYNSKLKFKKKFGY